MGYHLVKLRATVYVGTALTRERGILIQYFIQFGAAQVGGGPADPDQPEAAFRIPWGIQMVPAFILFMGLFFFPYSPRWLASKDRWEEAIQVLAKLHGNGDVNHPRVLAQYQEIEEALRFEREQEVSSFRALVDPRMFKRVILGMSIQMSVLGAAAFPFPPFPHPTTGFYKT
jgi:hypothetical protein